MVFAGACSPSVSASIAWNCTDIGVPDSAVTTFRYDGENTGKLTVGGASGPIELPAWRKFEEKAYGKEGQSGYFITAGAESIEAPMPERAKLDACYADRSNPDNDPDIALVFMMDCFNKTPPGPPIAIAAQVEIAEIKIDGEDGREIVMRRTFPGAPGPDGKPLKMETYFKCELAEPNADPNGGRSQ